MKQKIEWHKMNIYFKKDHWERQEKIADAMKKECERGKFECALYAAQIEEAIKRGIDEFDRDKFMQNKNVFFQVDP